MNTISSHDARKQVMPPAYFLLALLSMAVLHLLTPVMHIITGSGRWSGLALVAAGVAANILASRRFVRSGTPVRPFEPATSLVTGGVYRFTRNPMYLGMVMILAGLAITLGSATPWLIVFVFASFIDLRFIRIEERQLFRGFGPAYRQYCRATPRWI